MTPTHKEDPPPGVNIDVEIWRELRELKHEVRNEAQKFESAGQGLLTVAHQVADIHRFMVSNGPTIEAFKNVPADVANIRATLVEKATQDRAGIPPKHLFLIIVVIALAVLIQPVRDLLVALAQHQISAEGEGFGLKGKIGGGKAP